MRKLTGIGPPAPPEALAARVEALFTRVGATAAMRASRPYFGTLLSRLVLALTPPGDPARRVLRYIHFQSAESMAADDEVWRGVCAELPDLVYAPIAPLIRYEIRY